MLNTIITNINRFSSMSSKINMNDTCESHMRYQPQYNDQSRENDNDCGRLLCKNDDDSYFYECKWSKLSNIDIVNWHFNRPFDPARIPEIKELLKNQEYVDGIIYLAKDGDKFICYDGIHRIEALKELSREREYKNEVNHRIFVHYFPVYTEQKVKNKFEMLNKCVPVPRIYSDAERTLDMIEKVKDVIKYFTDKYPKMFKASCNPNIPHVNRDIFTDQVENILNELDLNVFSTDKIIGLFEEYNIINRNDKRIIKKLSSKQLAKCNENDCFIFAERQWYIKIVKAYINNQITLKRVR